LRSTELRFSRNSFTSQNFSRRAIVSTRFFCGSGTCLSEEQDFRAGTFLALLALGAMGGLSVENRPPTDLLALGEAGARDEVDDLAMEATFPRAGDGDLERLDSDPPSLGREKSSLLCGIARESSRLGRGEADESFLPSLPLLYKCRNRLSD
jgi:hypothetical protein